MPRPRPWRALLACPLILVACARPSAEECEAVAKKTAEMLLGTDTEHTADNEAARKEIEALQAEIKRDCQEKGTKREVDCIMAAKSLEDFEACAK